jgi:hypothetical protein
MRSGTFRESCRFALIYFEAAGLKIAF